MTKSGYPIHIVLLGDSIFDNASYVPGGPAVVEQLSARLPDDASATLVAVDGAVIGSVERQITRIPGGATHLVISAGGNDALGASGVLGEAAGSVADAVARLADFVEIFAEEYDRMLDRVLGLGLPTALCTIYDANYPPPARRVVVTALGLFNDVITRAAFSRGLPLIDLRLICSEAGDYANPIEPSVQGGEKIVAAIDRLIGLDRWKGPSVVIAG